MAAPLNPAENARRRRLAADHAPWIEAQLRQRLPGLRLDVAVEAATLPVDEEEAHVYIRADGTARLLLDAKP